MVGACRASAFAACDAPRAWIHVLGVESPPPPATTTSLTTTLHPFPNPLSSIPHPDPRQTPPFPSFPYSSSTPRPSVPSVPALAAPSLPPISHPSYVTKTFPQHTVACAHPRSESCPVSEPELELDVCSRVGQGVSWAHTHTQTPATSLL
ncbi:hypothetical protein BS50DRAFT_569122 [Corynespora cassiicola Philippines]|uniref:Uncharacterized protein n=1 Tax=Corynespora cassiicola Philippines TaxID=1448308 RepID=A0A2T2P7J5_CORCC|nr:hypothetical protein BS50DRAFT_569122 [Corynespora cassiicola Philippines]